MFNISRMCHEILTLNPFPNFINLSIKNTRDVLDCSRGINAQNDNAIVH